MADEKEELGRAADPERVSKDARSAAGRRKQNEDDLKWLLTAPQGRRFLYRRFLSGGIFEAGYEGDVNWMVYREGKRSVFYGLLAEILRIAPERYMLMMDEEKRQEETTHA